MAEQKMMMLLSPEEANYTPVSVARGKACSACRFFCEDHCHIVMGEIAPNGYCDRFEAPPMMDEPAPVPVMIVEPEEMTGEMALDSKAERAIYDRIWDRVKANIQDIFKPEPPGAFTVQKDLNGQWRWIATFTNNFQDRDNEIISDKALDDYLERLEAKLIPYPELWVGHVEGTKHGQADMVFGIGNFLVATGTFDDTSEARRAIKYYEKYAAKTPLSHGFTFPSWALKDGVYTVINTFEISTLPPPLVASNPYTDLEIQGMKQINDSQQAALAQVFGKDFTEKLVESRKQQSEDVKAAGVAFKDFVDATPEQADTTEAPADVKPIAQMIVELVEGQGELLNLLAASGKAYQSEQQKNVGLETRLVAAEKTIQELQAELKLKPRAASQADETALSDAEAEAAKADLPKEKDSFWSA